MGLRHVLVAFLVALVTLDQVSAWWWRCSKVDCQWGSWGSWSSSYQTRNRGISRASRCGGRSCSGSSVDKRIVTCPKCPACKCPTCPRCECPQCPACDCPACPKPECPKDPEPPVPLPEDPEPPVPLPEDPEPPVPLPEDPEPPVPLPEDPEPPVPLPEDPEPPVPLPEDPEPPVPLPEDPEPPVPLPEVPDYVQYGDLMKLTPTGASMKTAKEDKLKVSGVEASNLLLDADIADLGDKKQCYEDAGKTHNVHPGLIAALASRQSRGGRAIKDNNGYGEKSTTYGILGCDINNSDIDCLAHPWDSCEHINMMTLQLLVPQIKAVQAKLPDWLLERQLQGGVAAYDAGVEGVLLWDSLDDSTNGKDYSNDVIARAQRLVNQHGWVY